MSKNRKKIVAAIQGLGAPVEDTVMSGYVKTVVEEKATMSVVLNTSGQLVEGVLLHALGNSLKGFVVIPEPDSDVVICSVDGSGEYMLLQADKINKVLLDIESMQAKVSSKIEISCDNIVFNGGENGGIPISDKIAGRIKNVEDKVNEILDKLKAIAIPLAPSGTYAFGIENFSSMSIITPTTISANIENTKIKH